MIRVVIVEELQLTRSALVALLENEVDIRVVAEFAMGRTMVSATTAAQPDVVLVNTDVVGGQVPLAISDLQAIVGPHAVLVLVDPRTPLVLSIARSHHVPSLLIKDVAPWVLADAVRRLAEGKRVVDPRIAMAALVDGDIPLTPRELEILDLASSGETVSEIAARLRLAVGTVRNYLSKIITKTGARNRIDAVRIAREAGWLAGGTRNRIELLPTWPSRHQERPAL